MSSLSELMENSSSDEQDDENECRNLEAVPMLLGWKIGFLFGFDVIT